MRAPGRDDTGVIRPAAESYPPPPGLPRARLSHMAAIPESTRSSVALRLLDHAGQHWPQLHRVQAHQPGRVRLRHRDSSQTASSSPLSRLRYGGSAHSFGVFAILTLRPGTLRKTPSCSPDHRWAHPRSPRHRLHRPPRRPRTRTPDELTRPTHLSAAQGSPADGARSVWPAACVAVPAPAQPVHCRTNSHHRSPASAGIPGPSSPLRNDSAFSHQQTAVAVLVCAGENRTFGELGLGHGAESFSR